MDFLLISIVKVAFIIAYIYGLLWVLGHKKWWVKVLGTAAMYGVIELALVDFGSFQILSAFDSGLLYQAATMAMVAMGLNLIYGFNGQFSLGQWGFYGIGAYCAADITWRWTNGDSRGLVVVGLGVIMEALVIWGINVFIKKVRSVPVMSSFAMYLIGTVIVGFVAVFLGNALDPVFAPALGTASVPGTLVGFIPMQVIFFLSVVFAGIFAAEVSFLFGLPVLTLGSDYFGIATLGFTIVVNTLMINSDTILPFPEMKGGRGMIGIPKLTTWFWTFFFLVLLIVIMRNLIRSSTGRTILSVREDEVASKAMGINIAENKLMSFVIGSLFAGVGGAVYAHFIGFLSPGTFDFLVGFNPLIIVVFGGLGSMTGTLAASFGWIFFLEGMLRSLLGQMGTEAPAWRYVLYPITLLLMMLLKPQGLLGSVEWGLFKQTFVAPRKKTTKPAAPSTAAE
jgi:branched-chain amino acid transport system permease protein